MRKLYAFVVLICLYAGCMQCIAQKTDNVHIYKANYKSSERKLYEKALRHIKFLHFQCDTIFAYHSSFSPIYEVWYHKNNICYLHIIRQHFPASRQKYYNIRSVNINDLTIQQYFCCALCPCDDMPCFEAKLDGAVIGLYIKDQKEREGSVDVECLYSVDYEPDSFGAYIEQILKEVLQIRIKNP